MQGYLYLLLISFLLQFLVSLLLFYRHYGTQSVLWPYLVMVSGFIVATFVDFKHRIIPDEVSIGGMIAGVVPTVNTRRNGPNCLIKQPQPKLGKST